MFLRNYDNIQVLRAFYYASGVEAPTDAGNVYQVAQYLGNANSFDDGNACVKYTSGNVGAYKQNLLDGNYTGASNWIPCSLPMARYNIAIGNGNKPATYEDYKLSGTAFNNSNLNAVSRKDTYDAAEKKWKRTMVYTYTNETAEAITIAEWGLYNYHYYNSTLQGLKRQYGENNYTVLLFREVLDEPIVIEPGTTATLKFSVEIPMANHP